MELLALVVGCFELGIAFGCTRGTWGMAWAGWRRGGGGSGKSKGAGQTTSDNKNQSENREKDSEPKRNNKTPTNDIKYTS